MRLTNKTYTDVAHLPLAEAAEMLPKFTTKKGHKKDTQFRRGRSFAVICWREWFRERNL